MYPELKEKMMTQLNNDEELRELTNGSKFEIEHLQGELNVLWFEYHHYLTFGGCKEIFKGSFDPKKVFYHIALHYNVKAYRLKYRRFDDHWKVGIEFKLA